MRDSTIFYRSFYEAIKELNKEAQAEVYDAIFEYSLNFNEIELTGIAKTIFTLIKPQLQANIKRYKNGNEPKEKQKGSKRKAKPKQDTSKGEANANVNDNENKNDNDNENPFERFWNLYGKKTDRKKCESKFSRLKKSDIDKIFETLPIYIARTPDIKFRKDPSTYLNNESWNDEILTEMKTERVLTELQKRGVCL